MHWYFKALKQYAVFSGRARRREYWMFFLINIIIVFVLAVIEGAAGIAPETDESVLAGLYQLAVLIPSIAVGVRRMHDTDHSGWWLLVPIVNFVFAVTDGTPGENRFGPDPKSISQDHHVSSDRQHEQEGGSKASRSADVKLTTSERLRHVERLYEEGLITSEERDTKRRKIMDDF